MPDRPPEADAVQRLLRTTLESVETRRRDTFRKLPRDTQNLDALIVDPFWPQAIEPLLANGLAPHIGTDFADPVAAIATVHSDQPTRCLEFCFEDPARPLTHRPTRTAWYCRFGLEVSTTGYMLDKTTILSFPTDFELATLARFLREPLMAGCPPDLSYSHASPGSQPSYEIKVRTSSGAGWGRHLPQDAAREVQLAVHDHIPIIRAMDALEKDWGSSTAFDELYGVTVSANIAY